jgi:c-di-GMP-binding flagellar brake protein YcgR
VADSPAGPRHSVAFTRIREADFEAVVHFVINEERQQIRESRWSR